MPFLSSAHPQVRPFKGFLRLKRQTTRFYTWKCFFGVRKLKFNIIHKNTMAPMGKIKQLSKRS